jgi:hypothetical protein
MRPELQDLCIQYITDEWRKLRPVKQEGQPPISPPWGVWICLHHPISARIEPAWLETKGIRRAWFLSESGIEERNVWDYVRFFVVNFVRPWAALRVDPVKPEAFRGTLYNQIGMAHFAEFYDVDGVYVGTSWGMLYGQGCHMRVSEEGVLQVEKTLWRS